MNLVLVSENIFNKINIAAINTKTGESSEEESGESDVDLELAPPSLSVTVITSQSACSSADRQLQDSLLEEEQETQQPLVVNTEPVSSITQNSDNLENEERVIVDRFLQNGCGGCSSTFHADSLEGYKRDCRELTRAELDMALLGQLAAFTNDNAVTVRSSSRDSQPSVSRQKSYRLFWHAGHRVCRKTFLFLHAISEKRLRNLQKSLREKWSHSTTTWELT